LTTPAVTEPARPSGLPTATTSWPTTSLSASPSSAGSGVGPLARSTARSDSGSAPTTRNGADVPSENDAEPLVALPTTWALVSRNPSPVKTTAEPRLSPVPPGTRRGTRRLATFGVRRSATPVTICEYASSGLLAAMTSPGHSNLDYRITCNHEMLPVLTRGRFAWSGTHQRGWAWPARPMGLPSESMIVARVRVGPSGEGG